tara:strand:+ start:1676 stop:1900 length:225 start_codon:yes stop_codon:yes gene_type:complete
MVKVLGGYIPASHVIWVSNIECDQLAEIPLGWWYRIQTIDSRELEEESFHVSKTYSNIKDCTLDLQEFLKELEN